MNTSKRMKGTIPSTIKLNESKSLYAQNEKKKSLIRLEAKKNNIDHEYNTEKKIRQINSLVEITKKFIKYALESDNQIINLNTVAKHINVKKRRIYDITNVFEGN